MYIALLGQWRHSFDIVQGDRNILVDLRHNSHSPVYGGGRVAVVRGSAATNYCGEEFYAEWNKWRTNS